MTDEQNSRASWKTNPLPAYKHSLFCTAGSSCQTPGCKEMKSCAGHTNNCRNERCPAPPCIARRQLAQESDCQNYLNVVLQCAMWTTDICPHVGPARSNPSSDNSSPSTSSGGSNNPLFRVPNRPPPKKRPKLDPGDCTPKS